MSLTYQIAYGAADVVADLAAAAGSQQSCASPRSFDDADPNRRQERATAAAAAGTVERFEVDFGSNVGTADCCGAADAAAAAAVGTARSGAAAAAAAGDADACAADGGHVGSGGEWAAPRPPGQSFADCTAADLADGAASCERAAAMRGTGELQLSMAIIASSRPEQKPALARDPSTVKR